MGAKTLSTNPDKTFVTPVCNFWVASPHIFLGFDFFGSVRLLLVFLGSWFPTLPGVTFSVLVCNTFINIWLAAGWLLAGCWLLAGWLLAAGWLAGWLAAGWLAFCPGLRQYAKWVVNGGFWPYIQPSNQIAET